MKSVLIAGVLVGVLGFSGIASAQDQCAELRQACVMKRQLGEQGEGNCKKFRACKQEVCGNLRQACLFKREAGEEGQGNCKAYRATCRR
jgi:hypothetical protein